MLYYTLTTVQPSIYKITHGPFQLDLWQRGTETTTSFVSTLNEQPDASPKKPLS